MPISGWVGSRRALWLAAGCALLIAPARPVAGAPLEIHRKAAEHWAFKRPVRPDLPRVARADWCRSPIDYFILDRIEKEGLAPAAEADRYTLARRLSLDLTGLPPSPAEVDRFVADPSPEACERYLEKLLESPHYGERWALWWLDGARYADSNGYEIDRTRTLWAYRDWVIEAFNRDMRFDRFTIEQMAGDLLPGATDSQRVATGFHRNSFMNEEGGHDWEQFRYESIVDRVHTTATVFLGLTLACAQCHDHKYDPISQREYYGIFAFLNNADEPEMEVPDPEILARQEAIDKQISELEEGRAARFPAGRSAMEWTVLEGGSATATNGTKLAVGDDGVIVASGERPETDRYRLVMETGLEKIEALRLEALPGDGAIGRADDGNFVVSEIRLRVAAKGGDDWREIRLADATEERATFAQDHLTIAEAIDGDPKSGWAGDRASTDLKSGRDVSFGLDAPAGFAGGTRLEIEIDQNIGRHLTMRRFRLSAGTRKAVDPNESLPEEERRRRHLEGKFAAWCEEERKRATHWTLLAPQTARSERNATFTTLDDGSLLVTGDRPEIDSYTIESTTELGRVTGFRLEAIPDARLPAGGPGRGSVMEDGSFVVTEFRVRTGTGADIVFSEAEATFAAGNKKAGLAIDGNKLTSWHTQGSVRTRHVAVFKTAEPVELGTPGAEKLTVTILHNFVHQQTLGRFRLFATGDEGPLRADVRPVEIDALLLKGEDDWTRAERDTVMNHFLSVAPELAKVNREIADLRAKRPRLTRTLVLRERTSPRITRLHHRGEFRQPRDVVSASVPAILNPLPDGALRNRLGLARWITSRENPLFARAIVNQVWRQYFGRGLAGTPEDLGSQGSPPSHPQLLDWLATEFHREGLSLKALHRLIVTSATYRQLSGARANPDASRRDPGNILLARAPRPRLVAETVRDTALAAGGLLDPRIGGASVFPPQPAGAASGFGGSFKWQTSSGADRHRRGLYTFRKRTAPYASFSLLDAPAGRACTVARTSSNTPLQALALLNDEVIMEAARALAVRVLKEGGDDESARMTHAFRLCAVRPPEQAELEVLRAFYQSQLTRLQNTELDAEAIGGSAPPPAGHSRQELAAWTATARLLLNLDEVITRE